nr:unnamed protein product [Callosobruchus chinensis]
MSLFEEKKVCKYCVDEIKPCKDEGLQCIECNQTVHLRCLKRGSIPGGLHGDVFFTYKCAECSASGVEVFIRNKASWMQIIVLVLYHLRERRPGLARRGFFHWRHHVASFIDKNWDIIFPPETKMKKKWRGTIAGTLSHFSPFIFVSGTSIFKEPAWWTLKYTSLSPYVISQLHAEMINEKGVLKSKKLKAPSDAELFHKVLGLYVEDEQSLQTFIVNTTKVDIKDDYDKVNQFYSFDNFNMQSKKPVYKCTFIFRKMLVTKLVNKYSICKNSVSQKLPPNLNFDILIIIFVRIRMFYFSM